MSKTLKPYTMKNNPKKAPKKGPKQNITSKTPQEPTRTDTPAASAAGAWLWMGGRCVTKLKPSPGTFNCRGTSEVPVAKTTALASPGEVTFSEREGWFGGVGILEGGWFLGFSFCGSVDFVMIAKWKT